MNHKLMNQQLELFMHGELSPEEQDQVEQHLAECEGCRLDLERLKKLAAVVQIHHTAVTVDDDLLAEARQQLRAALRRERNRTTLWSRLAGFFATSLFPTARFVLGGAALLAGGIIIGRVAWPAAPQALENPDRVEPIAIRQASSEREPQIANLQFIDAGAKDGNVEFTFDAVAPVHMKGNINDERIQKILAHALVNDQNPGVRLRSVNAFASQAEQLKTPDPKVKAALLSALKSDSNPAVRREALRVLKSFPVDDEIREAYLHVLVHDSNPGMRIAAINSLDSARVQTHVTGPDLLKVLQEKMHSDENNYVRIRAKAVLQEVTNK